MLGIMNLVDAVRTHVPRPVTGSFSRGAKAPMMQGQAPGTSETTVARPVDAAGATMPLPTVITHNRLLGLAASSAPLRQQSPAVPSQAPPPQQVELPVSTTRTYSDKIRAIIYPGQAVWNTPGRSLLNSGGPVAQPGYGSAPAAQMNASAQNIDMSMATSPTLRALAGQSPGIGSQQRQQESLASFDHGKETSLEQLSRMLQEQQSAYPIPESGFQQAKPEPQIARERPASLEERRGTIVAQAASIDSSSLRASPIQDMPVERAPGTQVPPKPVFVSPMMPPPPQTPEPVYQDIAQRSQQAYGADAEEEDHDENVHYGLVQTAIHRAIRRRGSEVDVTSDNTLLDIVQSLPPMPAPTPPPAPPVLSGRATRSLGSVLLEGHLVPQNRLEVAQSVQRMLRGVDLNYHLGEILLMFKLLTPDQLLAASLVSFGLISTTQISALGRIRQELHAIGLEYDLENLVILFRILTPDQLREVRASWS